MSQGLFACLLLGIIGCDLSPQLDPTWKAKGLMSQAKSAECPAQFKYVLEEQAARPSEPALAESLATQLVGMHRRFAKNRKKGHDGDDPIRMAKVRPDGNVAFTYRRANARIGLQIGRVNRMGNEILFSGKWYQQSKMDGGGCGCGRSRARSDFSVDIDGDSAVSLLGYLDEGAFIYYGTVVDGRITLTLGKDLNLHDQTTAHESWLELVAK